MLSRAAGGRKIVTLPCAKDSGLAYLFAEGSDKQAVAFTLLLEGLACAAGLLLWAARRGSRTALAAALYLLALALWDARHRRLCRSCFGGITGDLTGFFISLAELLSLLFAAFGGLLL